MKDLQKFIDLVAKNITEFKLPNTPEGLYKPLDYFLEIGGKRLRPVLTLLATDLFNGDINKAIDPAIGIELFHNFTLIHDDIMDDAPLRRGMSTVHEKWNLNTAILSGDSLFIESLKKINKVESEHLKEVLDIFLLTAQQVCEGQQRDMDFETMNVVEEDEYIKMIQFKTSVLLGCSLQIGAIISGANKTDGSLLYQFGLLLGTSFQIKDDYLDAFGDPEKFGKQVGGDILANKKTILLVHALKQASKEQLERLTGWISKDGGEDKISAVKALYEEIGSKDYTLTIMDDYYNQSLTALEKMSIPAERKKTLFAFAHWLRNRDI